MHMREGQVTNRLKGKSPLVKSISNNTNGIASDRQMKHTKENSMDRSSVDVPNDNDKKNQLGNDVSEYISSPVRPPMRGKSPTTKPKPDDLKISNNNSSIHDI